MKIFYLANIKFPSEKSRSLSISRLCHAFADEGHQVMLYGLSDSHQHPAKYYGLKENFQFYSVKISSLFSNLIFRKFLLLGLLIAWHSRKAISKFKPDIVYSRLTVLELLFVPSHLPIVYEMHSLGPLGESFYEKFLFKLMIRMKNFKRIIVTTDFLANILRKDLPGIEVVVARLSAEVPVEISSAEVEKFKKENLKKSDKKFHVGFTGFIDTYDLRGTDIICKVATQMPDVVFHIIGGEPETVEYWKKYSQDLNKDENIFFYGYRKSTEIPYYLKCFDAVLAPLQYRPSKRAPTGKNMSPLKISQYLAYGMPVVASDIPSHLEVLTHQKNSLLVSPANDIGKWVSAIREIMSNQTQREMFEKNGKAFYYAELTPEIRVKKILNGLKA
jgi:glycosyltransferase involved in cell wall biosynthesis